ncbi:hypothetical protein DPX16_15155 [Anabarilius grahami]|uniref:Uncharacterized protein n=1 Tax=Anabarilius grahami TaxID=495550 RepID=A0A3N0YV87_ANAGA|nr:hypothetical protein DPX16_15155 [Anabarilius grahami]
MKASNHGMDSNLMELDELDRRVNAKQPTSANICENFWNRRTRQFCTSSAVLLRKPPSLTLRPVYPGRWVCWCLLTKNSIATVKTVFLMVLGNTSALVIPVLKWL